MAMSASLSLSLAWSLGPSAPATPSYSDTSSEDADSCQYSSEASDDPLGCESSEPEGDGHWPWAAGRLAGRRGWASSSEEVGTARGRLRWGAAGAAELAAGGESVAAISTSLSAAPSESVSGDSGP